MAELIRQTAAFLVQTPPHILAAAAVLLALASLASWAALRRGLRKPEKDRRWASELALLFSGFAVWFVATQLAVLALAGALGTSGSALCTRESVLRLADALDPQGEAQQEGAGR